jgi:cholesterol transport system auxiliary component
VLPTPSSASGELRLDSEILLLQQEFLAQPSQVRFVLRAALVDATSRRVIATRDFEGLAKAPSDDPYGGVLAANQAVQAVLEKLAAFCAEVAPVR